MPELHEPWQRLHKLMCPSLVVDGREQLGVTCRVFALGDLDLASQLIQGTSSKSRGTNAGGRGTGYRTDPRSGIGAGRRPSPMLAGASTRMSPNEISGVTS